MYETAARYYDDKVRQFGPTHRGVDWSTGASQTLRFDQFLRLIDIQQLSTINDFGSGYGALLDHLRQKGCQCRYTGFDIADSMIAEAVSRHPHDDRSTFTSNLADVGRAEYTVASGVFNVKQDHSDDDWQEYVLANISTMHGLSERGLAFNLLSSYSDPAKRRPDLFYARPEFFFEYCKTKLSSAVALLHDYPLYEFTIVVRN